MLLTFAEYQDLGGTATEDNYKKLEQDAEDLINPITNDYYVLNSIDTDEDEYRVRCFKKALELQINFSFEGRSYAFPEFAIIYLIVHINSINLH